MTTPAMRAAVGLILLALAEPAAAQTRSAFAEAGLLADYNPTLRRGPTTTAGITGSAGFFITPRWSLRAEADYPQWHETTTSREIRGLHQGVQRIQVLNSREAGRARSASVLVGRHAKPDSRVDMSFLAGLTMTWRGFKNSGTIDTYELDGTFVEHRDFANDFRDSQWPALTAGADATIALTKHLAIVPQVRVHTYVFSEHTSLLFVRPRVTLRYTF